MPPTLLRRTLAVAIDPAVAFETLYAAASTSFWLDAATHASTGMSYLGAATTVLQPHSWHDLLEGLAELTPTAAREAPAPTPPTGAETGPRDDVPQFRLGWVGWLNYELGTLDEELAGRTPRSPHPVATLLRVERAVEFDHATGVTTLLALDAPDTHGWLDRTQHALIEAVGRRSLAPPPLVDPGSSVALTHARRNHLGEPVGEPRGAPVARVRHGFARYAAMVDECRDLIARGEAYQLCLTNRFEVDGTFDPLATYRRLRAVSPSAHGGFIRVGGTALLSASPEQFLGVTASGRVTTSPVKGTRRRGSTPREDRRMIDELAASDKEQAENLMIVDLMRNDLARVCELGSVQVTRLLEVETHPQVHQLVSTVEGRLAPGLGALDAIASCFPAGSMTGAPKRRAMQHLSHLEQGPRGIYSGAFGYLSFDGAAHLAMVIRSIVLTPEGASVGAGGGITILSDPVAEVEETRLKAAALLGALDAALPPWPEPPEALAAP